MGFRENLNFIAIKIDNKIFYLGKKIWERFKVHHAYHFNKKNHYSINNKPFYQKVINISCGDFQKRLIKVIYGLETIFGS